MSFWDVLWLIIVSFAFIAYLMVLFYIVTDLFRDHTVSGGMKAVWIVLLIFFPLITSLVYLIARGKGMTQRQLDAARQAQAATDDYIRSVSGSASPADQIAQAKGLLDSGAITQQEFDALKAKALA
jgi:predicted PurR-regulated permease PerM